MDNCLKDSIDPTKITGITLMVFEGDIVRDSDGRIVNKLRETIVYSNGNEIPHEQIIKQTIEGT